LTSAIAYHEVESDDAGFEFCEAILHRGGLGHTAVVWADDERVIERFGRLPAGRVLVNMPGTWGTSGMLTTLDPPFSTRTGPWGASVSSANVPFRQTIQRRRVLRAARTPEELMTQLDRGPTSTVDARSSSAASADSRRTTGTPPVRAAATAGLNAAPASYA